MNIAGWEEMYRAGARGNEDQPTILLTELVPKLAAGCALDLACGAGRNALYLAENGWTVTAIDASESALQLLKQRFESRGFVAQAKLADLTAVDFTLPENSFDLIVIAYYLQRNLFAKAKAALRPSGLVVAIAHIPDPGEAWTEKRAAPGELRGFFQDWKIVHDYEGPSRDPAHKRPVSEIVAQRPTL